MAKQIKGIMVVHPERGMYKAGEVDWVGHYTRWVALLNSHKQITMDFAGLSDKTDFSFLSKYDFVFLYVLPVNKPTGCEYWWYDVPTVVAPYCRKLILQFDYEGIMPTLPPFIKATINNNVDALGYNSPLAEKWNINIPKYDLTMLQPVEELEKLVTPQPLDNIEPQSGIGVLWHSGTGCSIDLSLRICSRLPYVTKVFTSWVGMGKEFLEQHVAQFFPTKQPEVYGQKVGERVVCYPFMGYELFLHFLGKCSVFLEDNVGYYGVSRVAYECASLRIPVVGSTNSTICNVAYPFTTTNPQNAQLQTQLIKRLMSDQPFYDRVANYAYNAMKDYTSNENRLTQFVEMLQDLKVL